MPGPLFLRASHALMQRLARLSSLRRATMARARSQPPLPLPGLPQGVPDPVHADADLATMLAELDADGLVPRLSLRPQVVDAVRQWAARTPCFADDNPAHGFLPGQRVAAELALGQPILKATYFDAAQSCPALRAVSESPTVHAIARGYLGPGAKLVGRHLRWFFPTAGGGKLRPRAKQLFHRDVDDWAFVKFFFYVTPVVRGDGAHHFVLRSHRPGWKLQAVEGVRRQRWTDAQIAYRYGAEAVQEVHGPAGLGFAGDTFGLHKTPWPVVHARLQICLVFQLRDYRLGHQGPRETRLLVPAEQEAA